MFARSKAFITRPFLPFDSHPLIPPPFLSPRSLFLSTGCFPLPSLSFYPTTFIEQVSHSISYHLYLYSSYFLAMIFPASLLILSSILTSAVARPLPYSRASIVSLSRRAFALQDYADFQISGGSAGNAAAEANAVFVDPFGSDLSTVSADDLDNVKTMREAAEAAESDFNTAIAAAGEDSDAGIALQVGKIKNKVLKLTGEVQALKIEAAQGADNADKIAAEQKKLTNNIGIDTASSGGASTSVAGSASAPVVAADDSAETAVVAATATTAAETVAAATATAVAASTGTFVEQDYADFQISAGSAGTAEAEANAVFVDPFGSDLSTVSAADLKSVQTMREAAEAAETDFNTAIASAGAKTTAGIALQIKNKVLKLTGEVQALKIQAAQGADNADKIAQEQTKLTNNIKLDTASAGGASTPVV
ncbi:hypothetical protein BDY24DRAFT_59471 [Mrakia frigida]|uniref:uncharacterized protein n=1 Tax=Mrakia frigida TaxID=29902 RepID=UPI003FCC0FFE